MYFSDYEFECHCQRCKGKHTASKVSNTLKAYLETLRRRYGKPIYVSDAYRCPEHNREVGGVANSQHVLGTAADIYVDGNYEEFYRLVLECKLFDGVGHYPNNEFVHVDIRNNGTKPNYYRWEG